MFNGKYKIFYGDMIMLADERRERIMQILQNNGAVATSDLVELFRVSVETIRRDLLDLEAQGRLRKVHGGAVIKEDMKPFRTLEIRSGEYEKQKRKLAVQAACLVREEDIICIDSGSTAACFARVLKERFSSLTVVTHSLDVFRILSSSFTVILCGGYFMQSENAFYGPFALDMLEKLHVHKAFVCPSAVSLEYGIGDFQRELYELQRQMLRCADEICILADSSKFEKKALLKLENMRPDYIYVTDNGLAESLKTLYAQKGRKICFGQQED